TCPNCLYCLARTAFLTLPCLRCPTRSALPVALPACFLARDPHAACSRSALPCALPARCPALQPARCPALQPAHRPALQPARRPPLRPARCPAWLPARPAVHSLPCSCSPAARALPYPAARALPCHYSDYHYCYSCSYSRRF
ncbi:unnamed protein product, partial [Closterium sp. NIES-54]